MLLGMDRLGRAPRVHFSGVGGTGMVGAARLAVDAGWAVRGSDGPLYPPTSEMVAALGVPIAEGYAAQNLDWNPDVVVIGNALSRGNREVEAALDRHLHYVSMPEWVKDAVLRDRRPIVIAGTHGKTTTSAMTAFLLDRGGRNPGVLIGGQVHDFPHSARLGEPAGPFVIEGDEYDSAFFDKRAKFLHYLPHIAVVTSVEFDHGDIYRDLEEIELAFQRLLRQVPRLGYTVLCADSPGAMKLREHAHSTVLTYGFHPDADWRAELGAEDGTFQHFTVHCEGAHFGEFRCPLPGRHNVQNALAALVVESLYGAPAATLADNLAAFKGVRRRLEVFHEAGGVTYVDDFAHHPTAIKETIAAARARWPKRRLVVLFEPRSNTTVTNRFQAELTDAFAGADVLYLGPIYRADKYDPATLLDRAALTQTLNVNGRTARHTDTVEEILAGLHTDTRNGDVVLVLSNGAFGGIYARLKAL